MTVYEIISTIISMASLIVAVIAVIVSNKTKQKYEKFIKTHMEIENNSGIAVGVNSGDINVNKK